MTSNIPSMPIPVKLTELSAKQVLKVMKEEGLKDHILRIGVIGGGCSGLQYLLDFTPQINNDLDEMLYEQYKVQIIIDYHSAAHLMGTTIEYQDDLNSTGFKFNNPNKSQRQCGCGQSFGY